MNKNLIIVMAGALAVALIVAVFVQMTLGSKKEEAQIQEAKIEILVAAHDLGIGRKLSSGDTRWQEWPKTSVFPGAITQADPKIAPEKALEGRLARNIAEGEPILKNALLGEAKGNLVAASLEGGMRALALEVSASSMVGGFISPGDYVDIILTYRPNIDTGNDNSSTKAVVQMDIEKMATETILQNIKVLAVDQSAEKPEDDAVKVAKTVTLAVTAQDAERLSLAQQMGDITLSLRGVGDAKTVKRTWPTTSDARLTTIDDEVYQKVQKNGAGVGGDSVRIYNGNQLQGSSAP